MTGGFANAGYTGGFGFYGNPGYYPTYNTGYPSYYPAYNAGNPGYYAAFGNPAATYVPYLYGYPAYTSYGYNYWNPAYYAGYPGGYPYGYQGFSGGYGYSGGFNPDFQSIAVSDQEIKDDVVNRLHQNDQLKGLNIDVDVENGIMTLTGTVNTAEEKELAETLAFTVDAVRAVHNQLTVERQSAEREQPKRRTSTTRQRSKPQKEQ